MQQNFPNADAILAFAREELRRHMQMLRFCPEDYPVNLTVSPTLPADTYSYMFCAEGGNLAGSDPHCVLQGVYAYLRSIGFVLSLIHI